MTELFSNLINLLLRLRLGHGSLRRFDLVKGDPVPVGRTCRLRDSSSNKNVANVIGSRGRKCVRGLRGRNFVSLFI
jgi:hypothetical protein